jgi:hypothetical protein
MPTFRVVQPAMIACGNPECTEQFTEQENKRYCSERCRKKVSDHAARAARNAEPKSRICQCECGCGIEFILTGKNQKFCQRCRDINTGEISEFRCVDGEGIAGECLECDCPEFAPDPDYDESSEDVEQCVRCGHPKYGMRSKMSASGHAHKYAELGIMDNQLWHEDKSELEWEEIFEFLYGDFTAHHRKTVYAGFFLGYDFTHWLKGIPGNSPRGKAWQLLTHEGQESRKRKNSSNPIPWPAQIEGNRNTWLVNFHADRRLSIAPKICGCPDDECMSKDERGDKPHPMAPMMYVNDAGPFFQTAFLKVINPKGWKDEHIRQRLEDLYPLIKEGKERRETAELDEKMLDYNRAENEALSIVLTALDEGFKVNDISLSNRQWYGPGQPASIWMSLRAPKRTDLEKTIRPEVLHAALGSHFGGWFEITIHGHIRWVNRSSPRVTYEYDINSAYPWVISNLPCLGVYKWMEDKPVFEPHGDWKVTRHRKPKMQLPKLRDGQLALVYAEVYGFNPYIGSMLHRECESNSSYRILRPHFTSGWFWSHELQASIDAGLTDYVIITDSVVYTPDCDCFPPMREVRNLYQQRLDVGKNTILGKANKLLYNAMSGKVQQSIGDPPYNNWIWASLITAGCRTKILNAIATHPMGAKAVTMVATDAVFFLTPHPELEQNINEELGGWSGGKCLPERCSKHGNGKFECGEHPNITQFKPGFYWDDRTRIALNDGDSPEGKSRGVSLTGFASTVQQVDEQFDSWRGPVISANGKMKVMKWPEARFRVKFAMVTAKQAVQRHDWKSAGYVSTPNIAQKSDPEDRKRVLGGYDDELEVYRSRPVAGFLVGGLVGRSMPYSPKYSMRVLGEMGLQDLDEVGITDDGSWRDVIAEHFTLRG